MAKYLLYAYLVNICSFFCVVPFPSFTRTKGFDPEEDRLSARKRPKSSQDLTKELIEELVTQKEHV